MSGEERIKDSFKEATKASHEAIGTVKSAAHAIEKDIGTVYKAADRGCPDFFINILDALKLDKKCLEGGKPAYHYSVYKSELEPLMDSASSKLNPHTTAFEFFELSGKVAGAFNNAQTTDHCRKALKSLLEIKGQIDLMENYLRQQLAKTA